MSPPILRLRHARYAHYCCFRHTAFLLLIAAQSPVYAFAYICLRLRLIDFRRALILMAIFRPPLRYYTLPLLMLLKMPLYFATLIISLTCYALREYDAIFTLPRHVAVELLPLCYADACLLLRQMLPRLLP